MKNFLKNFLLLILIFVFFGAIVSLFNKPQNVENIGFNTLVKQIENNEVKKIEVYDTGDIFIELKNGKKEITQKEITSSLEEILAIYDIKADTLKTIDISYKKSSNNEIWIWVAVSILPLIFFGLFFWWMMKQGQQGAMQAFQFGKSQAKRFGAGGPVDEKVTFKDVADLLEAKEELQEVVQFLKNPKKFLDMGAKIPRGVLLIGPPGTGKTLLARAVANEAGVPFFYSTGSEFVEMFVGVGASRVRDLFDTAKKNAPCILFLDELDAVGRHRGAGLGGGNDEREQTLNQILTEMDGFEKNSGVIVLAATNRPDILDPALLRPGRFDRRIILDEPDIDGREEILKIHGRGKPLAEDINLREIAERTPGFSGADLANLMNEAAILAARRNKKEITQDELREAIEKVLLGPERKSHILTEKEKEIAAYHEAGHALVASLMPESEPVQKISIISRGRAAGYTLKLPSEERHLKSKKGFIADLATLLGGYCAEKIVFDDITTGASNDLREATKIARQLVTEFGMSNLGPITFGEKEELVFLGKTVSEQRNYSEKIAEKIDNEIEKLIKNAQKNAEEILEKNRDLLNKIAKTLMEKETIERGEFEELIKEKNHKAAKRIKKIKQKDIKKQKNNTNIEKNTQSKKINK